MSLVAFVPGGVRPPPDAQSSSGVPMPEQLTALAYIGQELTSGATLAEGFQRAMQLLDERLGAKRSALFLADARHRTLMVEAAYGMTPQAFRPRYGLGVAGRGRHAARPTPSRNVAPHP